MPESQEDPASTDVGNPNIDSDKPEHGPPIARQDLPEEKPPVEANIDTPYTAFTLGQQRTIITLVALAALSSPMTAVLYLPLIPRLADHFSVTVQAINLTITVYVVFQALAPLLLSTHSDTFGRRPIFLACFALYTVASLGLSLNRESYAGLIVLRAIQSLGASAVLSLSYGAIADIRPSKTRGKALGTVLACANLGTAVGPVIGGAIASGSSRASLWWAFWVMLIFSAGMLLALALLLPETARNIVGNGSISGKSWISRPLLDILRRKHPASPQNTDDHQVSKRHLAWKSPFQAILIVRHPDVALILWIIGFFYALWYTVQTSIPIVFQDEPYKFNELEIGLSYLPGAAGVIICMYLTGRVMDRNYKHFEDRLTPDATTKPTHPSSTPHTDDLTNFPIERARARYCNLLSALTAALTISYGWVIQTGIHASVPLIFQFLLGFTITWITNVFSTLLVDVFPASPSTAATAGTLARCGIAAAAVAVLDPFSRATNRAWFFVVMACLSGVLGVGAIVLLERRGMRWRRERRAKEVERRSRAEGRRGPDDGSGERDVEKRPA